MPPTLPEHWKATIREHVQRTRGEDWDSLSVYDFRSDQHVHIRFPDGSYAFYRYAFFIVNREAQEVGVFTEHCGYFFYPLSALEHGGMEIEMLQSESLIIESDQDV